MRLATAILAALWSAAASAQPGGTVTGAVQYRDAGGSFAGDDYVLSLSGTLRLTGGKYLSVVDPTASVFVNVILDGKDTNLVLDGEPATTANVTFPVAGKSGTLSVLFSQDLNSVSELSTLVGADTTAANRFFASPSGASGALSLRALANADLTGLSPTLSGLSLSSGTNNGLLYRSSSGVVQTSSGILAGASGTLQLTGGTYLLLSEPTAGFLMQTVYQTKTVNLALDAAAAGVTNVYFPVADRSGSFTVLFRQDLDSLAELDAQLASTGAPAATNLLSGGNAWLNLGTLNERASAPATPASGFGELWIDSAGTVHVISDVGGIYQLVREPAGGLTTGQVPVKQSDGTYTGSTLSDGHDALSTATRADDAKSHAQLYALAMQSDVDSMAEHSGHPNANVACQDGNPNPDQEGRRQIRTHGAILWQARFCTDTVGTSNWQPINEVYLGHFFSTSASAATGCVSFASNQGGQLVANCNGNNTDFVFGRDFLLTRVSARDTLGASNDSGGSPCKVQLWKNANTADPNTDGTHGTKLLTNDDTTSMAGGTMTAKTWALWDSTSEPTADWTFGPADRLNIEFDDAVCNGTNVQLIVDLWGVPRE